MAGPINNHVVGAYLMVGLTVLMAALAFAQARRTAGDPEPLVTMVGFVAAKDHVRVAFAPEAKTWDDLQVATSQPARVALNGPAGLSSGPMSLGEFVTVSHDTVRGGDAVYVCAIGLPAQLTLQVRDAERQVVLFTAQLSVPACL